MPGFLGLTTSIRSEQSNNSEPTPVFDGAPLAAIERFVEERLWPASSAVDRADRLPLDHFEAIAELGLHGMVVPVDQGGLGLDPSTVRRILRLLGSGCGATSFAFAQHHGTVGAVAASDNETLRARWLPALVDHSLAGIAYAHLRRPGPPVLRAEPDGDGWVLDGTAPWVTSWGTAAVFGVAAATNDGRMVWALVPGKVSQGLSVARTFDLMVYGATQTVALRFDRYRVDADMVVSVIDFDRWTRKDRFLAARPNPLCLGVGDRALACLADHAPELVDELAGWWGEVGDRAEVQAKAVDGGTAELTEVAAARAETLLAVQRLATALLAAVGGSAMQLDHPAQRLSRETMFYLIQAQSAEGRQAVFDRLAGHDEHRSGPFQRR